MTDPPHAGDAEPPQADLSRLWVLIPAYQPVPALLPLVQRLLEHPFRAVVIVNDGSDDSHATLFEQLAAMDRCHVLHHVTNLGKGAALKTGMNYGGAAFRDAAGCVTADADGQHRIEDVLRVASQLCAKPDCFVLGVRHFEGDVPLRSRLGNALTRKALRLVAGLKLSDTQTGLRGIPGSFLPAAVHLRPNGYDFEMEMLLEAARRRVILLESPIATVYLEDNRTSHFNPLLDSMRVSFVLLRFSGISLLTAGLDFLVFALVYWLVFGVGAAMVLGRTVAMLFNYHANRAFVFRSHVRARRALPSYVALVTVSGLVSYGLLRLLVHWFHLPVVAAKALAEGTVFLFNFVVQRDMIFAPRRED